MAGVVHIGFDASRLSVAERTGTERYSYELLAALARIDRRHRYTLYTNGLPATLPPLGANFDLRALRLPRLWTHLRLGPYTRLVPPDVLFVPAHVIPLVHPPRCVVTVHDLGYLAFPESHTPRRHLELELTTRWSLAAARRVIAISQATRMALIRHYGADPDRISVIYHGLSNQFRPASAEAIAEVRARYGLERPYFLYVGTIQPRKNLDRLITAFARMYQREETSAYWPNPAQRPLLVIGGKRGWLSEAIERRAREAGAGELVRLPGYLPDADLPALFSGALAFVFPSLYEGFGMPVLEAMACGAPVLTSNSSALPEVAGDAALLVDPQDTEAITAGLLRLAGDPDLRADLRRRGLARAAEFSWERCARETLALLINTAQAG